jgi:hypothetical protein
MQCAGHMSKLIEVMNEAHLLVDGIHKHAEGLDAELLLEVLMVTDADFSEPVDAQTLIADMKKEGLF